MLSVHVQVENIEKSPWKSAAEIGYVNVSGNTNTETTFYWFVKAVSVAQSGITLASIENTCMPQK